MTTHDFHSPRPFHAHSYAAADFDLDGLTVPYAGQSQMRLIVTSGMADAWIHVDPAATDLIAIHGDDGPRPRLRASASELRLSWPSTFGAWLLGALGGDSRDIAIVLHPAVEWTLQIRGGLSRFEADLASGRLARLEISGGVSDAHVDLPRPAAATPIRISGGVSDFSLRRPADTGVALSVSGGISRLCLDDQGFDAIGGGARLVTGLVGGDAPRYAVEISGGASNLCVVPR
jgi:hypothetical protein